MEGITKRQLAEPGLYLCVLIGGRGLTRLGLAGMPEVCDHTIREPRGVRRENPRFGKECVQQSREV